MAAKDLYQEPVVNFEQETFEIVDGFVETELVDGMVVKVWNDTMLMEDCGCEAYVHHDLRLLHCIHYTDQPIAKQSPFHLGMD